MFLITYLFFFSFYFFLFFFWRGGGEVLSTIFSLSPRVSFSFLTSPLLLVYTQWLKIQLPLLNPPPGLTG